MGAVSDTTGLAAAPSRAAGAAREAPRTAAGRWQLNLLLLTVVALVVVDAGLLLRLSRLQERVDALTAAGPAPAPMGLEAGTPAPGFALESEDGERVELAAFRGEPVLLMFSSVTCPACTRLYPQVRRFRQENPGLSLVMISRGAPEDHLRLRREQGFDSPILRWEDEVARAYEVPGTPFFTLVDAAGVVARTGFAGSAEEIEEIACGGPCQGS